MTENIHDISIWNVGDEAILWTMIDNYGILDIYHRDNENISSATKKNYLVIGKSNTYLLILIDYNCTYSSKVDEKRANLYGIDSKYIGKDFYSLDVDWIADRVTFNGNTRLYTSVKKEMDGVWCKNCKDFVYMAENNGEFLGLPKDIFICKKCRENNSIMYNLLDKYVTVPEEAKIKEELIFTKW